MRGKEEEKVKDVIFVLKRKEWQERGRGEREIDKSCFVFRE